MREEHSLSAGLRERGWAVAPGERFRVASAPAVRLGIATLRAREAPLLAADIAAAMGAEPARLG